MDTFYVEGEGDSLLDIIARYNAVAGINGGGFYDPNINGGGCMTDGIVITNR